MGVWLIGWIQVWFDTSNVRNMEGMFWNCQSESIDTSHFNTHKVNCMQNMFHKCRTKELDISSFKISKDASVERMFYGCEVEVIKVTDQGILDRVGDNKLDTNKIKIQ